jgi:tetratricopeptide (TPR) repeat protein
MREDSNFESQNAEEWFDRGNKLFELGDYEQAITSYKKALEIKPNYYEAWVTRGVALFRLEKYKEAIASYEKALEIEFNCYHAWAMRGDALLNLGEYEMTITSYSLALEIEPENYHAWANRGDALFRLGRYEEAIASYDQALKIKPDYYEAWTNRGHALSNLGRYEEAITSYDQALEIEPNFYVAWVNRGDALFNLGEYKGAIRSVDKALEIRLDCYQAWGTRGVALSNLGEYKEAIASYDQALKIKHDYYEACYNRGVTLRDLERYEEAITSYEKALEIKPDYYDAWVNRGNAAGRSMGCDPFLANLSPIAQKNPELNKRGYEGELVSCREGLKYIHQDTHPEGWGVLHKAIGRAHYSQWKSSSNKQYCRKAIEEYEEASRTLINFPEHHLDLLQDLIRAYFDVGDQVKVEELKRRASGMIQGLIKKESNPQKKSLIALKYAWLEQLTVDIALEKGELVKAWELAEKSKNACLTWLLTGWQEKADIDSPNYQKVQQLLNPATAIIYWHISPNSLNTFILKHGALEPLVLGGSTESAQKLYELQKWQKTWNHEYQAYCQKQKQQGTSTSWRDNLPNHLENLKRILKIDTIVEQLSEVSNLILIPHQELHLLPLASLFPYKFTITHLPCVQIALNQIGTNFSLADRGQILSVECPEELLYSEIESTIICGMFSNSCRIYGEEATLEATTTALSQPNQLFHFTGHGTAILILKENQKNLPRKRK